MRRRKGIRAAALVRIALIACKGGNAARQPADSTYVPADWFKEQTTCWMMPRGLIVSDTAMGR